MESSAGSKIVEEIRTESDIDISPLVEGWFERGLSFSWQAFLICGHWLEPPPHHKSKMPLPPWMRRAQHVYLTFRVISLSIT